MAGARPARASEPHIRALGPNHVPLGFDRARGPADGVDCRGAGRCGAGVHAPLLTSPLDAATSLSHHELLQYLSFIGTGMPNYWLNEKDADFGAFFGKLVAAAREMPHEQFLSAMHNQIEMTKELFDQITEEDLFQKEVTYPWKQTAALGEAIMSTSVKWLAAYKLQLFSLIKLCSDEKLGTADAWVITEVG